MKNGLYEIFAEKYYHGGTVYFYSDPHFGDLDCYKIRFPDRYELASLNAKQLNDSQERLNEVFVKLLDQMQIDNINKVVHKNDTLIILGDVGDIECVKKLKAGYKVLILGNHDTGASNYKRKYLVYDEQGNLTDDLSNYTYRVQMESYYKNGGTYGGLKFTLDDNKLFDEVYEGTLQIGPKIILSHEPVDYKYCLNIHGHTHNITEPFYLEEVTFGDTITDEEEKFAYYHYCVIGEVTNYEPTSLSKLIKSGIFKDVVDIHRATIDRAIERNNIDGQE